MTDRPIIFSGPMVRALIEGRKTQKRRPLKPQPGGVKAAWRIPGTLRSWNLLPDGNRAKVDWIPPKYAPGDRLYVREAFNAFQFSQDGDVAWPVKIPTLEESKEADELGCRYGAPQIVYRESDRAHEWFADQKWLSPIHMPRWASRLTLTVTDVRVQRLQDISEADAVAEGVDGKWSDASDSATYSAPTDVFSDLWNSLHGPDAWGANPWVVALTFTVERRNIDAGGA